MGVQSTLFTVAEKWVSIGKLLGLTEFEPSQESTDLRFKKNPHLRGNG